MEFDWVSSLIVAMTGLVTAFFGLGFWSMQKALLDGQQKHIAQKNDQIANLQAETVALRDRIDHLEDQYYKLQRERDCDANAVDNYIALAQSLKVENERLIVENEKLKTRLDKINPLP